MKALPSVAFAPGKLLEVWTSPDAPNFVAFGQEVNDVPVESLPVRPGLGSFLLYATWLLATGVAGLAATVWVANRFSRSKPARYRSRASRRSEPGLRPREGDPVSDNITVELEWTAGRASPQEATVTYRIDNGAWIPAEQSTPVSSIPDGRHTVTVRAEDPAGHVTDVTVNIFIDKNWPEMTVP